MIMASMTPGDCGSAVMGPEEISARCDGGKRKRRRSLIGAECWCLEFRDLAIFNDDASRRRVTEAIRRAQAGPGD